MTLSWCYHPFKRLFCPDDAFFEEGNIQCNLQRKQINCNEIEDLDEWSSKEFKCSVAGCNQYFVNIKKYEVHYRGCHWNSCRFCRKSFQTSFLLDLHILENHDTLFQMIATKKFMYRCLVETCPDKFGGEDDRKKHLVQVHKYPSDFRFNRPSRTQRKLRRQNGENKEQSTGDSNETLMETEPYDSSNSGHKHHSNPKPRPPRTICFGRGSSRGFHRPSRGNSRGKKRHNKSSIQEATVMNTS
ncbi:zinc finger protein 511 isoform X2 [Exaiptasia diaphana]|uniref:C2H2-type domain-containing protein n=1 Tax=Exaiptasia diaphana TaxID=2652724 RepID=A0A913XCW4_EXADI|nr:zinc finger protein 511 isoform X2 [Exaiptasia diaphana]XP_020915938.1 zinc finger protein 511 isoform X2 [Exaiptasia diaphana]